MGTAKLDWKPIFDNSFWQDSPNAVADLFDISPESVTKLFSFYTERSAALYKSNDIILWLKEIAGFVCDSFA